MTMTLDTHAVASPRLSPAALIAAWLEAGARHLSDRAARRRARANLRAIGAVSDATLRDIGVHRSELMSITMGDASGRRR